MLAETIQGWYAEAEAKGKVIGEAIGEEKGEAKMLILLLETKFMPLNDEQRHSVFKLKKEILEKAVTYIFQATSLKDMFTYIQSLH